MKRVLYLLLAMLALLMVSCYERPKTLKPVSSKIEGSLGDYFEVIVKDYKIIGDQVNLEFVRIKEGMMEPHITAEFLDENGNVLITSIVDMNSSEKELKFLLANKVGESSTIAVAIGNDNPTQVRLSSPIPCENSNEVMERTSETEKVPVDTIEERTEDSIVTKEETNEIMDEANDKDDNDEDDDEEETQHAQSSSSKDWDKVLDDYENYVDQYIELLKKASSGDMSAMTEYALFMEKAEKLEKDLDNAKDDLSTEQLQRLLRISKKMTDAALNM